MKPLVSVNITTYNRAHLLPRALDSVLSQTYKNLEIIVVDDCSSDKTSEVVEQYQKQDDRIIYIKHDKNKKLARSRNTALEASSGKYIAFMDDDDEWVDSEKLEKQVNFFESSRNKKIAIICSSVRLYQDNGIKDKIIPRPKDLSSAILSGNGIMYTPTVMMPKAIIDKVENFDINMPKGVDGDLYRTCIVKFGYEVYFMPDITTAIYEYGDDRITPVSNSSAALNTAYAHSYLLKKYFFVFLKHPFALIKRSMSILYSLIRYIKIKRYEKKSLL
mgnify:FL=1